MKNISEMNQDPIGKWIKESGEEGLSPEFYKSIITKLEASQLRKEYHPVINKLTMKFLIWTAAALFILGLIYLPNEGESNFLLLFSKIKINNLRFIIPEIPNLNIGTNLILNSAILIFSIMAFISMIMNSRKINY